MVTLFIRHEVEDFDAWRSGYDQADDLREQYGIQWASIHRVADSENDVVVVHQFDSMDNLKGFLDAVRPQMQNAGIVGRPTFWFTEDVYQQNY